MDDIRGAIKRGYGYEQLKSKLDVSEKEIVSLGTKHPEFLNEINKRYHLNLEPEKAKGNKEIKEKTKDKSKTEQI